MRLRGGRGLEGTRGWPTWVASFAILFALGAIWSLATPLFSLPDEPGHVIRAAALVRGQLSGSELNDGGGAATVVKAPAIFERGTDVPRCYELQPTVTADCAPAFEGDTHETEMLTGAGRYPPLYYAAVGLPSLFAQSATGVRLMRLVSVALTAALLASAFACSREAPVLRPLALGLAIAVTPMALYMSGGINPNGLEIAAAIGVWSAVGAMMVCPRSALVPLVRRASVAAALLAASRPSSLLYLTLAVVVTSAALLERDRLRLLVGERSVRPWAALAASAGALSLAWVLWKSAASGFFGSPVADDLSMGEILRISLGHTGRFVREMVGVFGALDTNAPLLTHMIWLFSVAFLLVGVSIAGSRRLRRTMLVLLATVVVLPVILESLQARAIGFAWQGRYGLPLAVGIPILASIAVGPALNRFGAHLARRLFELLALAHVLAFAWALRRFAIGDNGLVGPINWQPPFTAQVLLGAFVLASVTYALWLRSLWDAPPEPTEPAEASASSLVSARKDVSAAGFGVDGRREDGSVSQTKRIIGFVMMALSLSAAGLVAKASPVAAAPGRADLCGVKIFAPTGTNKTELHCLSAASGFKSFSVQTGTGLHLLDGQDDRWRIVMGDVDGDGRADLCGVKVLGPTGTNKTEIHCLSAASGFKTFKVQVGTGLHLLDGQEDRWDIVMGDVDGDKKADLCGAKVLGPTGTNKTELHCLSASSTFQKFVVQTGTGLHLLDGQQDRWRMLMGDVDADGRADLCGAKVLGPTGTNKTELHCLGASSGFKTFKVQTGTGLHLLDGQADRWEMLMGDVDADAKADLCGAKVLGPTGTNKTELHCLSAASNFKTFKVQTGTGLHLLDGQQDRWRVVMGDADGN